MASSSSNCLPTRQWRHEVFLSFRGEDTRDNFISHLYYNLGRASIDAFIDDEELERGKEIASSLLEAIEGSMISVVVFSKDYASSPWCLDELVKIMDCREKYGQLVIPVFYGVNPSDVSEPMKGIYAEAFRKHEGKLKEKQYWLNRIITKVGNLVFGMGSQLGEGEDEEQIASEKVEQWKLAMTKTADLSGFDSKVIRSDYKLVNKLSNIILNKLNNTVSTYLEDLVRTDLPVAKIKQLISAGLSDVRIIGLWGMGGIGKTTLAKVVYNEIASEFEACCFIANVGERLRKSSTLLDLVKEFLSNIFRGEKIYITTENIGDSIFLRRLKYKRVLIVLDDLTRFNQMEALAKNTCWFGGGSRIIATSRDKQVLVQNVQEVYEVKGLCRKDAKQLFYQHAFKQVSPDKAFRGLMKLILQYGQGHPLALKVLGPSLCGKSKEHWESTLNLLEKAPNNTIQEVLKIS